MIELLVLGSALGAMTPPLGFSTWQGYPGTKWGTHMGQYNGVTEAWCRKQADAMVAKKLVSAGYTYFIVDEPCFVGRDNLTGRLLPNSTTWPNGFDSFAKYLRDRGMKLGIYTDAGPYTCQGCPASAGHEALDVKTFVDWGASYVKVDRCFGVDSEAMREDLPATFAKYRAAATASSVPELQISAILAATDNCWEWCNGTCDHCRTTEDIRNSEGAAAGHVNTQSAIPYIETFAAGPGYFNDLDMLLLGNLSLPDYPGGLTSVEKEAHIALWWVLRSCRSAQRALLFMLHARLPAHALACPRVPVRARVALRWRVVVSSRSRVRGAPPLPPPTPQGDSEVPNARVVRRDDALRERACAARQPTHAGHRKRPSCSPSKAPADLERSACGGGDIP